MIDYIHGGEYMSVTSTNGSVPHINSDNFISGIVAYDGSSRSMKVYDGNMWQTIGGGIADINLNPTAIRILKWAEKKMYEEMEREQLSLTNPTVKDLLDKLKKTEEQLSCIQTLLREENIDSN